MATNQPLSDPSSLPEIEAVLGAGPPVLVSGAARNTRELTQRWTAIEERIASWAPASGEPDVRTDEDGDLLPNSTTVAAAGQIAARLRQAGISDPLRLGQTANGGINFEWRNEKRTERLSVNALGDAELVEFEDSKLVSRKPISTD